MVEIRGGGPLDGAILVDAASDSTLNRLIDTLTMQGNAAKAEKVNQMAQTIKSPDIDAATDSLKKLTKVSDTHHDSTDKIQKKFDELGKNLGTVSATLATKGITSIFDFFNTGLDSFRTLSNVGAGFNGNLTELSATALKAGLSVENFSKLIMSNSGSLVGIGGSAEEGARKLAQVSDTLTRSDITRRFTSMGMTIGDINGALTTYLDMQGKLGNLTKMSSSQIAEGTAHFSEEMDRVTRILGTNRQELMDAVGKNSLDPVLRQINANLKASGGDVERAMANQATLLTTGGESMKQAFLQVATGMPKDDMARALMQFGKLSVDDAKRYLKGELGPDELGRLATNLKGSLSGLNEAYVQAVPIYREASTAMLSLGKYADANFVTQQKLDADRNKALNSFGAQLGEFGMALGNAYNKLKAFFVDSPIFRSIEDGLKEATNMLRSEAFTGAIKNFAAVLSREFENFVSEVKRGYQNGGIWSGIMAGLSSLWDSLSGPIASGIDSLFRQLFPKVFADVPKPNATPGTPASVAQEAQTQRQGFGQTFDNVISNIRAKATEFFQDLPASLAAGITNASGAFGFLFGKLDAFIDTLPQKLGRVKAEINNFMSGISLNPIQSLSAEINNFSTSLGQVQGPIGSLIRSLSGQMGGAAQSLSSSAISGAVNSLSNFIEKTTQALQSAQNVNTEKIQQLVPVLGQLGQGIRSLFMPGGSSGAISDFISRLGGADNAVDRVVATLTKLEGLDSSKLQGMVTSMSNLKGLGVSLGSDVEGVRTFASEINSLRSSLEASASAAERLKAAAGSLPNGYSTASGGGGGGGGGGGMSSIDVAQELKNIANIMRTATSYLDGIQTNTSRRSAA